MRTVRATPASRLLLAVLSGNMLLDALEVSLAVVTLPSIGRDLHLAPAAAQWVVTGFAVGFGGLLLVAGRLVAGLGRRRVYLAALLVFAAASVIGGLADGAPTLIASRMVKGWCAALTAPTGLVIICAAFREGAERARALSVYSLFGASGFTAGLLLAGALTPLSWRWAFLFPAPVALALFVAGLRALPADPPAPGPSRYDLPGAALLLATLAVAVHGLATGPRLVELAVAAGLLAAFAWRESVASYPLVTLALLRRGHLVRATVNAALLNGTYWGLLVLITYDLQDRLGWSPLAAGAAILPASVPLALVTPYTARLVAAVGPPRLIAAGATATCAGGLAYAMFGPLGYLAGVLPALIGIGAGFVLAFAALHVQAISGVPAEAQPMAGGLYQTGVQAGGAVTVALVVAVWTAGGRLLAPSAAGGRPLLFAGLGLAGVAVAAAGLRPRRA
jgi:MFS family permease